MRFARVLFVVSLLFAGGALAAPPAMTEIAAPAAVGSGEPFVFAMRDGLLLSWLEPVPNTKKTALRFAVYRAGRWSASRTVVQRADLVVNFPSVVEDARGTLFAHWLQKSGNSTYACDVRVAISKDGGR